MACQVCGLEAPTKSITLYQNIGLVVTRQWSRVEGNLCRRCIGRCFKSYTLTTLFLGWWGLISFFLTPLILINNVVRYLGSLSLPEPGIEGLNTPLAATATAAGGGASKSFKFKVAYGVIVWTVAALAFLSTLPSTVEKYYPRLNKLLHSGTPSSDSDIDYRVNRLDQDFDSYNKAVEAGCPEKASFKDCRNNMLAAQSILDDVKEQREALLAAWNAEKNDRTIPASCRDAMDAYHASMAAYWANEARLLQVYRGVNPDSKESVRSAVPQFEEISKQEETIALTYQNSAKKVSEVFATPECQGY